jgi:hypothetical protein
MTSTEAAALALSIAAEDEAFAAALDETGEFAGAIQESGDITLTSGAAEVVVTAAMLGGESDEPAEGDAPPALPEE